MAKVLMSRATRILSPGLALEWGKKRPLVWSVVDVDDPNDIYQFVDVSIGEAEDEAVEVRQVEVKKSAPKKKAAAKKAAPKKAASDEDLNELLGGFDGLDD